MNLNEREMETLGFSDGGESLCEIAGVKAAGLAVEGRGGGDDGGVLTAEARIGDKNPSRLGQVLCRRGDKRDHQQE